MMPRNIEPPRQLSRVSERDMMREGGRTATATAAKVEKVTSMEEAKRAKPGTWTPSLMYLLYT
jgi:hypothetical protein